MSSYFYNYFVLRRYSCAYQSNSVIFNNLTFICFYMFPVTNLKLNYCDNSVITSNSYGPCFIFFFSTISIVFLNIFDAAILLSLSCNLHSVIVGRFHKKFHFSFLICFYLKLLYLIPQSFGRKKRNSSGRICWLNFTKKKNWSKCLCKNAA